MSFRDNFLFSGKTYAEWSLETTTRTGLQQNDLRLSELRRAVRSKFDSGIERITASQSEMREALLAELGHQTLIFEQGMSGLADSVDGVALAIQNLSDYLGSHLCEIRWAVERHTRVSKQILEVLLASLDNESRQYFEQGVACYEALEYELAQERFDRALDANRTNHFAYQYLGFVALHDDDPVATIRQFDLARKFAPAGYHKGLAEYHLARAYYADGDLERAISTARAAAEEYPSQGSFWYALASYSALASTPRGAVDALRAAIERDWTYWGVVLSDPDFEPIDEHVEALLDELRQAQRRAAQTWVDRLKRIGGLLPGDLTLVRGGAWENTITNFERRLDSNDVFEYRAVEPEAESVARQACIVALEHEGKEDVRLRKEITKLESDASEAKQELTRRVTSAKAAYKPWHPAGCVYGLLWFGYTFVVGFGIIGQRNSNLSPFQMLAALSTFIVPWFIPAIINLLNRQSAERAARRIDAGNRPRLADIDAELGNRKSRLQQELEHVHARMSALRDAEVRLSSTPRST